MSTWVIISWVCVAIMTAINVFLFLKLKGASEQMIKMAFPNAKNMGDAMAQMQGMMAGMGGGRGGMNGMSGMGGKGNPFAGMGAAKGLTGGKSGKNTDAQLKAAMEMLQKSQKKR